MFPTIHISGSPFDRGQQHGLILRDSVQKTWGLYRRVFNSRSDQDLEDFSVRIEKILLKFTPNLLAEMQGIAVGSGLKLWEVLCLNARTELLHSLTPATECTSVYFSASRILGQNWDFAAALEKLAVVLSIQLDELKVAMITEPGMIGKIGLNSSGVGVCLNRLTCKEDLNGLPASCLLRLVLEAQSFSEAVKGLEEVTPGSEITMLVGDADGNGATIEVAGSKLGISGRGKSILVHTNHYVDLVESEGSTPEDIEHSATRYRRAIQLASHIDGSRSSQMRELLADRCDQKFPICREYEDDPTWGACGTISTLIMNLAQKELFYTAGNPLRHDFNCYRINAD